MDDTAQLSFRALIWLAVLISAIVLAIGLWFGVNAVQPPDIGFGTGVVFVG